MEEFIKYERIGRQRDSITITSFDLRHETLKSKCTAISYSQNRWMTNRLEYLCTVLQTSRLHICYKRLQLPAVVPVFLYSLYSLSQLESTLVFLQLFLSIYFFVVASSVDSKYSSSSILILLSLISLSYISVYSLWPSPAQSLSVSQSPTLTSANDEKNSKNNKCLDVKEMN